jgi:hypothetical protein
MNSIKPTPEVAARRVADRAVVADIECFGVRAGTAPDGSRLYDLRPMLDENEHGPDAIEMANQAIAYAKARGLITDTATTGVVALRAGLAL